MDRGLAERAWAEAEESEGSPKRPMVHAQDSRAGYPARFFPTVRATAGGAAVRDDTQAQRLAGGPKVSLLLSSRLQVATYLAGDPKRKE